MKFLLDEEIEIFPKVIFWFSKPKEITTDHLLKLLKKDVLILEAKYDFLKLYNSFEDCKKLGIIINLDDTYDVEGATPARIISFIDNLLEPIIDENSKIKIVVHSKRKEQDLLKYFDDKDILFFSNDIVFKKNKINYFLEQMLSPIFEFTNQRTSLRLAFKNAIYKTEINFGKKTVNGIIKDISLNGAGLVLDYEVDYNNIHVGDFVTLTIDFKVLFFKILRGVVIRKNQRENLLGVKIDLDDPYMIDDENMVILNKIIDSWVSKLLAKEKFD
ncbi:MAG TPA: PilZ domain-containing protein [Spirochaetota bacterium]|nr:PilZ domain-containing protein [Spirochaetota bacterium]